MKTSDIAKVLERDLLRVDDKVAVDITRCFSCGCSMTYRGSRFCSDRCREAFDNGGQLFSPSRIDYRDRASNEMKATTSGFRIRCACCGKEFDSKGLRCCSVNCERGHRERQENLAAMAEVGIEPVVKRRWQPGFAHVGAARRKSVAKRLKSPHEMGAKSVPRHSPHWQTGGATIAIYHPSRECQKPA